MMNNRCSNVMVVFIALLSTKTFALDTTHTHPLVTKEIADLIQVTDDDESYLELYETIPDTAPLIRRYWGTDFDPNEIAVTAPSEQQNYLLKDNLPPYGIKSDSVSGYDNVIDGVVQEDAPSPKVLNHFFNAITGEALSDIGPLSSEPSDQHAMVYFNEAVRRYSGYTEDAKKAAYFEFGQALHHVEDMITPAHIHNATENAHFASMQCCGTPQNTHVANSTLRFFEAPRLALKQTDSFSGIGV